MIRKYILEPKLSMFESTSISVAVGAITPGAFTLWNCGAALTVLVVMSLVVAGMEKRK